MRGTFHESHEVWSECNQHIDAINEKVTSSLEPGNLKPNEIRQIYAIGPGCI